MLSRILSPSVVWIGAISVILPSAGETTRPEPSGIARSGSRKNQRKNAASRTGMATSNQLANQSAVKKRTTAATSNRLIAYQYPSRTMRFLKASLYGRVRETTLDPAAHQYRIFRGMNIIAAATTGGDEAATLVQPQGTDV